MAFCGGSLEACSLDCRRRSNGAMGNFKWPNQKIVVKSTSYFLNRHRLYHLLKFFIGRRWYFTCLHHVSSSLRLEKELHLMKCQRRGRCWYFPSYTLPSARPWATARYGCVRNRFPVFHILDMPINNRFAQFACRDRTNLSRARSSLVMFSSTQETCPSP